MRGYIRSRIGRNNRRPGRGKGGKSPVSTHPRTVRVAGYDSEMVNSVRS